VPGRDVETDIASADVFGDPLIRLNFFDIDSKILSAKKHSIWLIHEELVGVKWMCQWACFTNHFFTRGVLWVA